jgi:hypothetical protein
MLVKYGKELLMVTRTGATRGQEEENQDWGKVEELEEVVLCLKQVYT